MSGFGGEMKANTKWVKITVFFILAYGIWLPLESWIPVLRHWVRFSPVHDLVTTICGIILIIWVIVYFRLKK